MNPTSRQLTETALLIAVAVVIEFAFRILPRQPQGGSIDITMLPLIILAYRQGFLRGLLGGMIFGVLNFLLSGLALHWGSFFLDYLLAFGALASAAWFFRMGRESAVYFGLGILAAGILRFALHVVSGVVFFGEYAPEGTPVLEYSLTYNFTYMGPSIALTLVIGLLIFDRLKPLLDR